jgi:transcriptional regulator GlxA family with amidase domain
MFEVDRSVIDRTDAEHARVFSFVRPLSHGDERILEVQHWLQARTGGAVTVAEMACRARMEKRAFLRRFKVATGMKPSEYAQRLRLEKAGELLIFTNSSIEQIAWSVGFGDTAAFRCLFICHVGITPGKYRPRFVAAGPV